MAYSFSHHWNYFFRVGTFQTKMWAESPYTQNEYFKYSESKLWNQVTDPLEKSKENHGPGP